MSSSEMKFRRLKVDAELIQTIDNLANLRGDKKADVIGDTIDWFINNRTNGSIAPRYFASPNDAPYAGMWLKPETIEKIETLAKADSQNPNRVLYTALARFIEKEKS
ncbi:hypothetical protein EXT65_21240 [Pectobacterium carotovorum subsp. carotovorum]|nr:hypothetical protein [Pectobacterium carotovorum]MCL6336320.1 hypothetical protein [Pectobacterium carotovorum subsp. carotovorum]